GTIGGLGTLIGTPPLIILAGQMKQIFDVDLNFAQWMLIGVPVVIVMLGLAWAYMNFFQFKHGMKQLPGGRKIIVDVLEKLGKITREEKWVLAVFILAASLWILRDSSLIVLHLQNYLVMVLSLCLRQFYYSSFHLRNKMAVYSTGVSRKTYLGACSYYSVVG